MQCPSCQFENMPGIDNCGRCGSILRADSVAIDVHPPRASVWAKRRRRLIPFYCNVPTRLGESISAARQSVFGDWEIQRPPSQVFLRMVLPGWPQIYCGYQSRGRAMLVAYLVLLSLGLVFLGTGIGNILLGLALSCHASTIIDVIFSAAHDVRSRIVCSLQGIVLVAAFVYSPAIWLITRVAVPQVIVGDTEPFQAGDVILYNPSAFRSLPPQNGDIVIYNIPRIRIAGRHNGNEVNFALEGMRIDRVLAGPGQKIDSTSGQLYIDGTPALWSALNAGELPANLTMTVPPNAYLIFPSSDAAFLQNATNDINLAQLKRVCLVPSRNILGRVYLRHQPLSRMWFVR